MFSYRPDLIEFDNLKRSNAHYNLQNAFNVAEKELGLTKLLDPEGGCLTRTTHKTKHLHQANASDLQQTLNLLLSFFRR